MNHSHWLPKPKYETLHIIQIGFLSDKTVAAAAPSSQLTKFPLENCSLSHKLHIVKVTVYYHYLNW